MAGRWLGYRVARGVVVMTRCNEEEMLRVRALIEQAPPEECSMAHRDIAYYATIGEAEDWIEAEERAMQKLNLTPSQASVLFYCHSDQPIENWNKWKAQDIATKADMLAAIDNVIKDGMPHWQDILRGRV